MEEINDPELEVELGHDVMPWVGYTWFHNSRFVDERVSLAERAPWVVANTPLPLAHPLWREVAWDTGCEHHDADPADQDLGADLSVESESLTRTRCIVDSATTFHIIYEKGALS